jgi:hypothetical protein
MPNHLHGILVLTDTPRRGGSRTAPTTHDATQPTSINDAIHPTLFKTSHCGRNLVGTIAIDIQTQSPGNDMGIKTDPYFPWPTIATNITVVPFVSKDTIIPRQVFISSRFAPIIGSKYLVRSWMGGCD